MSAAILVYFKDSKLPTVAEWNAAIKTEGFDVVLDPFEPRSDNCYRPATIRSQETGFEWYLTPISSLEPGDVPESHLGDCDCQATLSFISQADEEVTACVAGAVLAKLTGGWFVDNDNSPEWLDAAQALELTRQRFAKWQQSGR